MGLPRTGSSLLENTIGRSPGVLELAEVLYLSPWRHDFPYFVRSRIGDLSRDGNLRKMVDIIFSQHDLIPGITGSFWRMGGGIKAIGEEALKERVFKALQSSDRSYAEILRVLLREITIFNDCRRCLVSFPVYLNHLETLVGWFPGAKVLHITRDPRAIAISKTNDPGGTALYNQRWPYLKYFIRKAMIAFVVVQYIWASRVHARFKGQPNYLLVKYEDFILDPEGTVKQVCAFTEIQFTAEMMQQSEDRAQRSSISGEVRTKPDARAASKWMDVITRVERLFVTCLCKRSMTRFGFDPETHPIYANVPAKESRGPRRLQQV
jgi:hypothetical protein